MYYTRFKTPLCPITLIGDEKGIQRLYMHTGSEKSCLQIENDWLEDNDFFTLAISQIQAYLTGSLKTFSLKLNPQGTAFQKQVWQSLREIPYGEFRTYKEQAILCGKPKASRAVGAANGRNPIPIIVPCHRVIGSSGKLTGFAFGLETKKALLNLEKSHTI